MARQPLERGDLEHLTTNQGVKVANNQDQLTAGPRGGTLMEDFIFREKMTHFDHERIPERVVHARGSAAHGVFRVYDDSMRQYTKARFLIDPRLETPTFTRFSTVVGFRGSADTVRDVRGFATKFYTVEGNYDLVGNNIPVFFIQDGMKFPDLVHSIKPEPHHEMPQASAAHDNFWDFISLMPEAMHMIMWVLSDRALPRSYATMEGFGVHTFRLVNEAGNSTLCKIHWKPMEGLASLLWDETQKIAGKDPDFNRRDLWERIEKGLFPEFELGFQLFTEEEAASFDFDVLDPTKIVPEELVPVRRVGKMTLNRNPDNFFAETEQVAFHPGHIVPGIDFTNDPLLQARLFSYLDTQLNRFGSANFAEVEINRPRCPVFNNQRDGFMRMTVNKGRVNYEPNSLDEGCPREDRHRGFVSLPEPQNGHKLRARPESFNDHFSQAELFWNSQSEPEKDHLIEAIKFELGKVEHPHIRERMIQLFHNVSPEIAERAAPHLGLTKPTGDLSHLSESPAPKPGPKRGSVQSSPALSQEATRRSARGRRVAILVADGVAGQEVEVMRRALEREEASAKVVSIKSGPVATTDGVELVADENFSTAASVIFDATYVPGGSGVESLLSSGDALHWLNETFKHCKPICATNEGIHLLESASLKNVQVAAEHARAGHANDHGVVTARGEDAVQMVSEAFLTALAAHRFWNRPMIDQVPA
ncbi:MAG TPA: catalase [Fimbriimonadaceae bacterium]|nr:catalase [Fimbriimonadaceae bacterium]